MAKEFPGCCQNGKTARSTHRRSSLHSSPAKPEISAGSSGEPLSKEVRIIKRMVIAFIRNLFRGNNCEHIPDTLSPPVGATGTLLATASMTSGPGQSVNEPYYQGHACCSFECALSVGLCGHQVVDKPVAENPLVRQFGQAFFPHCIKETSYGARDACGPLRSRLHLISPPPTLSARSSTLNPASVSGQTWLSPLPMNS